MNTETVKEDAVAPSVLNDRLGEKHWCVYCKGIGVETCRFNQPNAKPWEDNNSNIPSDAICFFKDGDQWCCVFGNFINLQESPAGFGDDITDAMKSLQACA